jgi:2-phosphosulfolactate phosphatase
MPMNNAETPAAAVPAWATQAGLRVRFDWGPQGVERLAPGVRTIVIVDVLRFTSAVETSSSAGVIVYPYRWRDDSAAAFAESLGAELGGRQGGPGLSPLSLKDLPSGSKVVLPSPNGATCSLLAEAHGATVAAGCLRNAAAVAAWLDAQEGPVGIIACGEVWRPDGSIRPALEDMLGAGAIISHLREGLAPEAAAAAAAFRAAEPNLAEVIRTCASGRELEHLGRAEDVPWCAHLDISTTVPVLANGSFKAATTA